MKRQYSSGTKWEPIVGYSRAVRIDNFIWVTGTTATDEKGNIVGIGDPYAQAVQAIRNIERALHALDAKLDDVVRTRIFVRDISQWEAIGKAHAEHFSTITPATTMIEVSRFIDDEMLVEIEADAFVQTTR